MNTNPPNSHPGRAVQNPTWLQTQLYGSNPVVKYSVATLVVFGSLYVAQSYGLPVAWPIALLILLGMLVLCKGQDCPTALITGVIAGRKGNQ